MLLFLNLFFDVPGIMEDAIKWIMEELFPLLEKTYLLVFSRFTWILLVQSPLRLIDIFVKKDGIISWLSRKSSFWNYFWN
jgi:hypothetical protein